MTSPSLREVRRYSNDGYLSDSSKSDCRSASSVDLDEELYAITGSRPSRSHCPSPPPLIQRLKKRREAKQHVVYVCDSDGENARRLKLGKYDAQPHNLAYQTDF